MSTAPDANWSMARTNCQSQGGDLAVMETEELWDFVIGNVRLILYKTAKHVPSLPLMFLDQVKTLILVLVYLTFSHYYSWRMIFNLQQLNAGCG